MMNEKHDFAALQLSLSVVEYGRLPFLCLNDNLSFLDEIVNCSSLTIQSHVSRNTSIPIEVLFSLVMGLPSEASLEVCSKLLDL
jgi:hypothetical protein